MTDDVPIPRFTHALAWRQLAIAVVPSAGWVREGRDRMSYVVWGRRSPGGNAYARLGKPPPTPNNVPWYRRWWPLLASLLALLLPMVAIGVMLMVPR